MSRHPHFPLTHSCRPRPNGLLTGNFRDNKGRCLNCHGTDHSFRNCAQSFINASGCINPQLGQLGDNGETFRRWKRRMLSYRRSNHVGGENTRSSLSLHRHKNSSRRYDNNRRNNNGHSNSGRSHHGAHNFNTATQEALKAVAHTSTR